MNKKNLFFSLLVASVCALSNGSLLNGMENKNLEQMKKLIDRRNKAYEYLASDFDYVDETSKKNCGHVEVRDKVEKLYGNGKPTSLTKMIYNLVGNPNARSCNPEYKNLINEQLGKAYKIIKNLAISKQSVDSVYTKQDKDCWLIAMSALENVLNKSGFKFEANGEFYKKLCSLSFDDEDSKLSVTLTEIIIINEIISPIGIDHVGINHDNKPSSSEYTLTLKNEKIKLEEKHSLLSKLYKMVNNLSKKLKKQRIKREIEKKKKEIEEQKKRFEEKFLLFNLLDKNK